MRVWGAGRAGLYVSICMRVCGGGGGGADNACAGQVDDSLFMGWAVCRAGQVDASLIMGWAVRRAGQGDTSLIMGWAVCRAGQVDAPAAHRAEGARGAAGPGRAPARAGAARCPC